jgi:hypothetical protein
MAIKIAVRLRIKPPKRRSALQRLRSRLYYRKNKSKIRLQRRKYLRSHKTVLKHRKMFQRYKPIWYKKPPKPTHHKPKKFKVVVPHHFPSAKRK